MKVFGRDWCDDAIVRGKYENRFRMSRERPPYSIVRDAAKAKRSERDGNKERCPAKIIEGSPRFEGPCRSRIRAGTYSVKEGKIAAGFQKTPLLFDSGSDVLWREVMLTRPLITARDQSLFLFQHMSGVRWC